MMRLAFNSFLFLYTCMGLYPPLFSQNFMVIGTRDQEVERGKIIYLTAEKMETVPWFNSPHPLRINSSAAFNAQNELILYTNGCYVFDTLHLPIEDYFLQKDTDIEQFCETSGSIIPNSTLFVPAPGFSDQHYLLYQKGNLDSDTPESGNKLICLRIDSKEKIIFSSETIPIITPGSFDVALHDNGEDYWLAVVNQDASAVEVYLMNKDGFQFHSEFPVFLFQNKDKCKSSTHIQFSNDNKKLLIHASNCFLSLCTFDACKGQLSNLKVNVHTASYTVGSEACFSDDGKYIFLHRDKYNEMFELFADSLEVQVFLSDKIGSSVFPELRILTPPNYSMGRIVSRENEIYIFNRFSDSKFLKFTILNQNPLTIQTKFEATPFWYYPSFSRNVPTNNNINKCITAISEYNDSQKINVYPNPASSEVFLNSQDLVSLMQNFPLVVNTIDSQGKRIQENILTSHSLKMDVSNLPSGLYYLEFKDSGGNLFLEKILIAR